MKKSIILKILLSLTFLCIPNNLKAEGQEGLFYMLEISKLIYTTLLWSILYLITIFLIIKFGNKKNKFAVRFRIGILFLTLSLIHFGIIKYDAKPHQGLIDEFIHRKEIKRFKEDDALRGAKGQLDSVLEICDGSIIPDEVGIYVWLDGKKKFVREINTDIEKDKENDSLTWSIIKSWKK